MGMFSGLSIRFFSWPIRTWIKKIPNLRDWYFMTKYWLFWHERLNIIFLFSDKFFGSEKFFELKLSLKSALHIAETAFFKEKFKCLNNSLKALLYKFDIKATLITTGIGCFKSFGLSSMVQYPECKRLICATHISCVSKIRVQILWEKSFIKVSDTHCSVVFLSYSFSLGFLLENGTRADLFINV